MYSPLSPYVQFINGKCLALYSLSVLPLRLNYKLTIGWQCQQEMGKIPNFTDSEWLKTPKTDCVLKVYKDKEFYQLGLQVC